MFFDRRGWRTLGVDSFTISNETFHAVAIVSAVFRT